MYVSMHEWPLYPGTGRLDDIGDRRRRRARPSTSRCRPARPATCTSTRSTRSSRRWPSGSRPPGSWSRPATTPTGPIRSPGLGLAAGDYADLTARLVALGPGPAHWSCSSRAATTSTRCGIRSAATVSTLLGRPTARSRRLRTARAGRSSTRPATCTSRPDFGLIAPIRRRADPGRWLQRRLRADRDLADRRSRAAAGAIRPCRTTAGTACGEGRAGVGSRSAVAPRRRARRVRRPHQGRFAAVHPRRRPPRAHRHPAGVTGRDRAHRVRDHAEATRRGVHRDVRSRLRLLGVGARPLPRERHAPARLGRSRAAARAERHPVVRGRSVCRRSSASSPTTSAASSSSPARPVRERRRRSAR